MQGSMKVMMWGMNIMFVFMCFQMPVGFSLYYGTSNIFMMLQTVLTYKVYNPEKFKAQYEAEVAAKRAAKKRSRPLPSKKAAKRSKRTSTSVSWTRCALNTPASWMPKSTPMTVPSP